MSGASNLGYGNTDPFSKVDGQYVNVTGSNYAGNFSSNEVLKGGLRRRIKRVTRRYKRGGRKSRGKNNSLAWYRRHFRRSTSTGRRSTHRRSRSHKRRHLKRPMRGGYSQYMNNMPSSASYQVAGIQLPASQLGLANPAPFTRLGGEASSCVDNYNHYTNTGFPSKGH